MRTARDFISLTAKIQMDLNAAQAKMTELRAWIANLNLPAEDPRPFDTARWRQFIRDTGWAYTDRSLFEELQDQGADESQALELVAYAVERRGEVQRFHAAVTSNGVES